MTWLAAAGDSDVDSSRGVHYNRGNLAINAAVNGRGVVASMKALASGDLAAGRLVVAFDIGLPLEYACYPITLEQFTDHRIPPRIATGCSPWPPPANGRTMETRPDAAAPRVAGISGGR